MKGIKKVVMSMMVLCLVLVGLLTPERAYAKSDSDFVIENGVLTEYQGSGGDVIIPDGVTKIGDNAFSGCSSLTSVTIPDSVTEIGTYAFDVCSKLKEFTIPKNVTKLGFTILVDCDSLEKITILSKKLNLIETFASGLYKNKDVLSTILGITEYGDAPLQVKIPTKTLTIYGYKYSKADEFIVRMNTLQVTRKAFGIKSLKFVPLDKNKNTLDKIKVPKSITITKGKSKKLSIQLPSSLKRVKKFTKKQG